MTFINFSKISDTLPTVLEPDTMYMVLNNGKVLLWITDQEGDQAYPITTLSDLSSDGIFSALTQLLSSNQPPGA